MYGYPVNHDLPTGGISPEGAAAEFLDGVRSEVAAMGDIRGESPVDWSPYAQMPAVTLVRSRLLTLPVGELYPAIEALHVSFAPPEAVIPEEPPAVDKRTYSEKEVHKFLSSVLRSPNYAGWGNARNQAISDAIERRGQSE